MINVTLGQLDEWGAVMKHQQETYERQQALTAQDQVNKKREYFNQLNKEMDMKNQQREMERMNRESEARAMQQKLQDQQMLTDAMKEQEKVLKQNLSNLNRKQIEDY